MENSLQGEGKKPRRIVGVVVGKHRSLNEKSNGRLSYAGFAAQSLLAALGSIQFVSNVFFASTVLGEKVRGSCPPGFLHLQTFSSSGESKAPEA